MRYLILGGRGFIGSHLVDELLLQGHQVRSFDRSNIISLNETICNTNYEEFEGDFASEADVDRAVHGCDICFHLVSTTLPKSSNADPSFDIETNLLTTVRFLNRAVRAGMKKVVFLSSGGTVYGRPHYTPVDELHPENPICSYGITKLSIEKYLHLYYELHGLDYAILRLSNPYGARQRTRAKQGAVGVFLGKALQSETVNIWGDGSVVRDYVHISDVVQAIVKAAHYSGDKRIFNIGSGNGLSINEMLASIEHIVGVKTKRQYVEARPFDVPVNILCIDRAMKLLDWEPKISFFEGIERTAQWYIKHLAEH